MTDRPLLYRARAARVIAALLLAWVGSVAAELVLLGGVSVESRHGEPLRAVVATLDTGAGPGSLESVTLAPQRVYEQLGLPWDPVLDSVRVLVDRRPDGRPEVRIVSVDPVSVDDLTLLLDVQTRAGRYQRSFLLRVRDPGRDAPIALPVIEPPAAAGADPVATASADPSPDPAPGAARPMTLAPPAAAAAAPPIPSAPEPAPRTPGPGDGLAGRGSTRERLPDGFIDRITVAPGTTLGAIARSVQPSDATLEQTIVALFGTNREAFENGNLHRLRAGATLLVPDPLLIDAFRPEDARRQIRTQWQALQAVRPPGAGAGVAPERSARGPAPPGDLLVLAPPVGPARRPSGLSAAEAQAAFDAAMREAASRIRDLEQTLAGLNTLLALTEQRSEAMRGELARLTGTPGPAGASPPPAASGPVAAAAVPAPVADLMRSASDIATLRAAAPVSAPVAAPAAPPAQQATAWSDWVWPAAAAAGVLLLLGMAGLLRRQRRRSAEARSADDEFLPDFGATR